MLPRSLRTAVSLVLGLVFFTGLTGEAYGFHECPHHDRPPGEASTAESSPGAANSADHTSPDSPRPSAGDPLQAPPQGPCICVGNCHAVPTALGLAERPRLPPALIVQHRFVLPTPDSRVRRPHPYRLPFANGPPALLS